MKLRDLYGLSTVALLASTLLTGCLSKGRLAGFFGGDDGKDRALVVQRLLGDKSALEKRFGASLKALPGNVLDFGSDDPERHKRVSPDIVLINEDFLSTPEGPFRFATVKIGGVDYALKIPKKSATGTVHGELYELPAGLIVKPSVLREQIALETYPLTAIMAGSVRPVTVARALMAQTPIHYDLLPDFIGTAEWQALGKESPKTLVAAAESLLRAEDARVLPELLPALEAHLPAKTANPLLLQAAKSKHPSVRREAALAYAKDEKPTENVLRILVTVTSDDDSTVRLQALEALARFDVRMDRVITALEDDEDDVAEAMRGILDSLPRPLNDEEVTQLSGLAEKADEWKVRNYALSRLGKSRRRELIGLFIGRLNDSDGDVRKTALALLEEVTLTEKNLPALKTLSASSTWRSRNSAVTLLAGVEGTASTELLLAMIGDSKDTVSRAAINTIETRPLEATHLNAVKALMVHKDWEVRKHAALLLKEFDVPGLEALISDRLTLEKDEEVKQTLVQVLQIINARKKGAEESK